MIREKNSSSLSITSMPISLMWRPASGNSCRKLANSPSAYFSATGTP
jgi:hypothetical protein